MQTGDLCVGLLQAGLAGSCREVYLKFSREDLAGNVTEIQFPVEKA